MSNTKQVEIERVENDILTTALLGHGSGGGGHRVTGGGEEPKTHDTREDAVKDAANRLRKP